MSTEPLPKRFAPAEGEDPFVGRRRELAAIGATLDAVASGRGRMEIVSGAPGIGKTRLADEIATIAARRGLNVLRGGCWEGGGAPAYWPWTDLLRAHLGEASGDAGAASDFSELVEIAATRAGVPNRGIVDVSKDAQQARFMLFNRFCEFLEATAAAQPILVIVDDGHWADIGSLLLLQFLASRLADRRIAVLLTSREPLSEMVASTSRHAWARHRVLHGLSRTEARALLGARAVRTPAPDVLDRLMRLTDGNPYFLKELGHLLVDGEKAANPAGRVKLPASLLVVTLQQYHRLSLSCRTLLHAAAVVGREFDAELASRAIGMSIRDAVALLDEAVDGRVIAEIDGARYRFTHALVREAVLDQLHPSDRTRLHESIGVALERQAAAGDRISPAALAHHFCMGLPFTQRRQAATYGIDAGESAHRAFAYEEAVFQLRRAQEVSGTSLTEVESCDLLLSLGAAEGGAGEWTRSRRTFEDAAALARRINCPARFARAALGFKGMMWATVPVDLDAVLLLEEARSRIGKEHIALEVELLSALSRSLYFSHETERAQRYSDAAMALASATSDSRLHAIALEAHTVGLLRPDRSADLLRSANTLVELSERLRDPQLRFDAKIFRQYSLLSFGDLVQADQELDQCAQISQAAPNPRRQWQVALLRAARATLRGNLLLAEDFSSIAQDLGTRVHDSSPAHYQLLQGFQRALLRDDLAGWLEGTEVVIARFPNVPAFKVAQALILARLGQMHLAREALHQLGANEFAAIPPNNLSLWLFTALAEVAFLTSQTTYAATLYQTLSPYSSEYVVAAWGALLDGSVSHYLALLARTLGDSDTACSHFEAAIAANRMIGAPALTARSCLYFGIHLTDLDPWRALDLATDALGMFSALKLVAYAQRAEDLVSRLTIASESPRQHVQPTANTEINALRRNGDYWLITYKGKTSVIRHSVGIQHVATLLSRPAVPVHVLDLAGGQGTQDEPHSIANHPPDYESDIKARNQYRQRLRDLSEEIDLAERNHDIGTTELLERERTALLQELSRAFSISGSPRPRRSDVERARISVRNRITAFVKALRTHDPKAARHFERSIQTGALCTYDPSDKIEWNL